MDALHDLALRAWTEASYEGVIAFDVNGRILFISTWLLEHLGLRVTPRTVDALLSQVGPAVPGLQMVFAGHAESSGQAWGSVRVQRHPSQQLTWQRVPLQQATTPVGSVVIFRDAATQGHVELTKQSFLSMISHDLRTPLSTILGFAELLRSNRESLTEAEQTQFLEHIIKNANQLSRYAQIALDVMYLEADMQHFETEAIALGRFVKHWLRDANHRLSAERLVFQNGAAEEPLSFVSAAALHRIMYILVEFALAESPAQAPIDIGLDYDQGLAHLTVRHYAPGLHPEDIPNLFRVMHPRDLSEEARPSLHRMQLYVASLLAERQRGALTIKDAGDQVFVFDLALPLLEPAR